MTPLQQLLKAAYGGSTEEGEWDVFDPRRHGRSNDPVSVAKALERLADAAEARGHDAWVSPYRYDLHPDTGETVAYTPRSVAKNIRDRHAQGLIPEGWNEGEDEFYPNFYTAEYARGPRRWLGLRRGRPLTPGDDEPMLWEHAYPDPDVEAPAPSPRKAAAARPFGLLALLASRA